MDGMKAEIINHNPKRAPVQPSIDFFTVSVNPEIAEKIPTIIKFVMFAEEAARRRGDNISQIPSVPIIFFRTIIPFPIFQLQEVDNCSAGNFGKVILLNCWSLQRYENSNWLKCEMPVRRGN